MCPACRNEQLDVFYTVDNLPVHSVLNLKTCEQARGYTTGQLILTFCPLCGFIFNSAYNSKLQEYSCECEESQAFSATFNHFAHTLAQSLVKRYNLYNKKIIEIGSGKGEFLATLCELGNNRGIGFDPAYVPGRLSDEALKRIHFIRDFYSEKYNEYKADFICCKMTLEHISDTGRFIRTLRQTVGDNPDMIVFFQIPDVNRILDFYSFEDIYYEHCSYFSAGSLARLFRSQGFDILDLRREYADQYLVLEAKPQDGNSSSSKTHLLENDLAELTKKVDDFPVKVRKTLEYWREKLLQIKANNHKVVIWGSGSKGVSFLTTLKIEQEIQYVVDINPYRQGTYMACTGQQIMAPEFLQQYRPQYIIIMNSIYRKEIQTELDRLGVHSQLITMEDAL